VTDEAAKPAAFASATPTVSCKQGESRSITISNWAGGQVRTPDTVLAGPRTSQTLCRDPSS
jgi:hypothetical protein